SPTAIARTTAKTPACIEARAPQTMRERTSRPRSSVPNGCAHVGGLRIWAQSVRSGSLGATHGAPNARIAKSSTTAAPARAGGRRRARRQPRASRPILFMGAGAAATRVAAGVIRRAASGLTERSPDADAGIQDRVRHVHEQIDEHVGARGDEHHALHE